MVKRYFAKDQTSVGSIEGIYSVSSYITKKGKGILSSSEKDKMVSNRENYSKVAIIRDGGNANREYLEVPLDKSYLPSYSIRGEFTAVSEGNIMVYRHLNRIARYCHILLLTTKPVICWKVSAQKRAGALQLPIS